MSLPRWFDSLRVPVVAAPLFIISNPDLVIAECKAGIVGSFPSLNARPIEMLDQWLTRITEELDRYNQENPDQPAAPFAVNQIVHRSNDRLWEDVELCVKHKVPIIITSLGARPELNEAIHSYGGIVLHDIINNRFAHKAIEKAPTAHRGRRRRWPCRDLVAVRPDPGNPRLVRRAVVAVRLNPTATLTPAMGADLAYIGSPFIATKEANAAAAYKEMIVEGAPMTSSTAICSPACTATT